MSIGNQIKKYRKVAGLKQVVLEEISGVAGGTISAMEIRGNITSRFLPQLAHAFGLTVDQLIDESTDYTEQVMAHVAHELERRKSPSTSFRTAQVIKASTWARAPGSYWPFGIERERVKAALLPEDIARADAYLLALVETREREIQLSGIKNNGTNRPEQR